LAVAGEILKIITEVLAVLVEEAADKQLAVLEHQVKDGQVVDLISTVKVAAVAVVLNIEELRVGAIKALMEQTVNLLL
jgi:hypothetical protein